MKIKAILILLLMSELIQAQNFENFKVDILSTQLPYANQDIKTQFIKGKVYYFNSSTNTQLFSKGFDIGYPFFLKNAIVQENGKYGIIDTKGEYVIKPMYESFKLAPYENNIVLFNDDVIFDLDRGNSNASYIICEEPAYPELHSFIGDNKKSGVKNEDEVIIKPIYDTIYGVEPKFIIAAKNKKIGLIDLDNKQITGFKYKEVSYSEDTDFYYTYPIIGLRKNKTWTYFENGTKILDSKYGCKSFVTLSEDSIGIFSLDGKENVLFKNGEILDQYYDFISEDGLVGIIGNKIFILKSDRSHELYYQEN